MITVKVYVLSIYKLSSARLQELYVCASLGVAKQVAEKYTETPELLWDEDEEYIEARAHRHECVIATHELVEAVSQIDL